MVQPPTHLSDHSHAGMPLHLATRPPTLSAVDMPVRSVGRLLPGPQVGVRRRVIRQVVVLEVAGPLADVVQDLDQAIQLALADGPRGVVCDLSEVLDDVDPAAVEVLVTAGRHVDDWPGIPVAVACPDRGVRAALTDHPLGRHLIVTASLLTSVSAVLATPVPAVERLRLAPHPTAPRTAREFVTRTLQDWGLDRLALSAGLVVRELVANSMIDATNDIDLSISWDLAALRVTVRDHNPDMPRPSYSHFDRHGRRLSVVAVVSRAFGALPTTEGGKVAWAVLNAARPRSTAIPRRPEREPVDRLVPLVADVPAGTFVQ